MINLTKVKNNNGNGSKGQLKKRNGKSSGQELFSMDAMPVPAVVVDKEFNVRNLNSAGAVLMGHGKEELIGKKCYDLLKLPVCNTEKCQACCAWAEDKEVSGEVTIKGGPKGD